MSRPDLKGIRLLRFTRNDEVLFFCCHTLKFKAFVLDMNAASAMAMCLPKVKAAVELNLTKQPVLIRITGYKGESN